jgi:hypothetical protein
MDRIQVVKSMQALQHDLAYNDEFSDLSGYATELAFLIKEYKRLSEIEISFEEEKVLHDGTKRNYLNVINKMQRSRGFLALIREEMEKEIPNLRSVSLLAKEQKPKERRR